jgi:Tol biopolymer transport system component
VKKTYLELGRRKVFGRPVKKPVGPVAPAPDPQTIVDFDLGTWRVRPALGRMTRADRIVALEDATLRLLLCLVEAPRDTGVNRDELAARVFGPGEHEARMRRHLGLLRRVFSEDGAVRIENAPGDNYVLVVGSPVPGRGLRPSDGGGVLAETPGAMEAWLLRKRRRWTAVGAAALVVLALGTALFFMLDGGNAVVLGRVTATATLAAEPGAQRNPSFAPDGRQVVYSWKPEGERFAKLYIRAVGGANPRPLTQGIRDDVYPAWSPSGNLIAFQRLDGPQCEVWVIRPDGTDETQITECSADASGRMTWTADGNSLIFANRTDPILPTQLLAVLVAQQQVTGVTNPVIGQPGDTAPALSANGRRLVFQRARSVGVADLQLIELSVGQVERVTRDGVETYGAAWEPGGRSLLYASPRAGRSAIWRTRLDGMPPSLLLAAPQADLRAPAVSNDGRQLAYERWRTQTRVLRVPLTSDLDTAPEPWLAAAALDREPQLSPDRSRVAFVSDRSGRDQIWLAATDASGARPLTKADLDFLQSPRWSPDGRALVIAGSKDGRWSAWRVDVGTGALARIDEDGNVQVPSFSRDGRWLYFASDRTGRWEIWRRAWPDGRAEQITTEGGFAATEARDGDTLYFVRPDRNGLWKRPREPGGDDVLVTPELAAADWANWHVTEDAIYFVARPDRENAQLSKYSLLSESVERIRPLPGLLPRSGLTLTADGRGVLVAQVAKTEVDLEVATLE